MAGRTVSGAAAGDLALRGGRERPPRQLGTGRCGQIERAVLRGGERGQFAHDQPGDLQQVPVSLHQAGDARQVGVQPVLLAVGVRGLPQVGHHQVDVVLELGDLAARVDGDGLGEVALGDRTRHARDSSHLGGEVTGQAVHALGQSLPGTGHAFDLGLPAEAAFGADLAGHPGDLVGEGGQLAHHGVERLLELKDLPARVHVDLLAQVALRHRGRDLGDVPHLSGQVVRHRVHVLGEVFPDPGDPADVGLPAEAAFGADLAGHPGDLVGEGGQLAHHGVERLLELEHLALRVDGDLLAQVTFRDRRRDLGDVPDLHGEVGGHAVDGDGQVFPYARDPADVGLPAEAAFGADLAGHPGDLVGEGGQLVDHGVEGLLELEHLALGVHRHLAGEVAARHGRGDHGDVPDLLGLLRHLGGEGGELRGYLIDHRPDVREHGAVAAVAEPPGAGAEVTVGQRGQRVTDGLKVGVGIPGLCG